MTSALNGALAALRIPRPRDAAFLAAAFATTLVHIYAVLLPQSLFSAESLFALHKEILAGTAPEFYQYQMYVHAPLLERMLSLFPDPSAGSFAALYTAYYSFGSFLFLLLLFRLCRRFASPAASGMACLYLASLYPLFWYDNFYHPSDPFGCALAALLVELLLDGKQNTPPYYLALLASGFLWEKALLLPLSAAAVEKRKDSRLLLLTCLALACAGFGQALPRWLYGLSRPWHRASLSYNLMVLPVAAAGFAALFAMPLGFMLRSGKECPSVLRALTWQFPVWLAIYLAVGGRLTELRGVMVMVVYCWPMQAMLFDRLIK